MNKTNCLTWIAAMASTALCTAGALGATVTTFGTYGAWSAAAGDVTTIAFDEVPLGTLVTDEYEPLGVLFTDTNGNWTTGVSNFLFPQDGYGLDGEETIELTLLTPAVGVAAHFPGFARFRLFLGETLLYQSPLFGASGVGHFGGVMSTAAFDRVEVFGLDIPDQVALDNLYLSFAPVPAPGAALVLALGLAVPARRRRT